MRNPLNVLTIILMAFVAATACGDDDVTSDAAPDSAPGDATVDSSVDDALVADVPDVPDVPEVDPSLFLPAGLVEAISEVECTLSDGSSSVCLSITTKAIPPDHETGPWCPSNVSDGDDKGGIWPENDVANEVSGQFLAELPTFYDDDNWAVANTDGSINFTETAQECADAARPDVAAELQNHCVQCLSSYVDAALTNTYLIPKNPKMAPSPGNINGNVGVSFNGVRFDGPAPTDAILSAYTIAPFDDCGGHINLNVGYHYHAVTDKGCLTSVEQSDEHAKMIGYAMDGFPMHEMLNGDGNEPADLDGCRGHADGVRGYHYHASGPGENMILGCWSGLTVQANNGGGGDAMDCTEVGQTRCCGDDVCDGPETAANCASDCA